MINDAQLIANGLTADEAGMLLLAARETAFHPGRRFTGRTHGNRFAGFRDRHPGLFDVHPDPDGRVLGDPPVRTYRITELGRAVNSILHAHELSEQVADRIIDTQDGQERIVEIAETMLNLKNEMDLVFSSMNCQSQGGVEAGIGSKGGVEKITQAIACGQWHRVGRLLQELHDGSREAGSLDVEGSSKLNDETHPAFTTDEWTVSSAAISEDRYLIDAVADAPHGQCPQCGSDGKFRLYGRRPKTIVDIPWRNMPTRVILSCQRLHCMQCQLIFLVHPSAIHAEHRMTDRCICLVRELAAAKVSNVAIAKRVGVEESTIRIIRRTTD